MHQYSVQNDDSSPLIPWVFLGVVSIAVLSGAKILVNELITAMPNMGAIQVPSVLAVLGIVYLVFEKYAWKWAVMTPIRGKVPNLNGEWDIEIVSSFSNHKAPLKGKMIVEQTWRKMTILVITDRSVSYSLTASIDIRGTCAIILRNQYSATVQGSVTKDPNTHEGTNLITFRNGENGMSPYQGNFYTDWSQKTYGNLKFSQD